MMRPTLLASARHLSSKSCVAPSAGALRVLPSVTLRGLASGASCEVRPLLMAVQLHAPCMQRMLLTFLYKRQLVSRSFESDTDLLNDGDLCCDHRWVRTCLMAQRRAHQRCTC